jgi:hypothetical protein
VTALVAALAAQVSGINVQLSALINLQESFAAAGIHGYAFDGAVGNFGAELAVELATGVPGSSGPGAHANAIVLLTTLGMSWNAIKQLVRVTP